MRTLRIILQTLACLLLGAYAILIIALDQGAVQRYIADVAETELEKIVGTDVEIERVSIGLFNAVELHNVMLYDKASQPLLQSELIYGKVRIAPLLKGKVFLRNISIIDGVFLLYKETADGAPNYQFLIDAFKTDKPQRRPLDLTINSLLLRRCQLVYDEHYQPYPADGRFSPHHIFARDVNANVSLKQLTRDALKLRIRQFSLTEQSGLCINNLRLQLQADRHHAELKDFKLDLPNSHVSQSMLAADYDFTNAASLRRTLTIGGQLEDVLIATDDVAAFAPRLRGVGETLLLRTHLRYSPSQLSLRGLTLGNTAGDLDIATDATLQYGASQPMSIMADADHISLRSNFIIKLATTLIGKPLPKEVAALGDIHYKGTCSYRQVAPQDGLLAQDLGVKGLLITDLGQLDADISLADSNLKAVFASSAFNPSVLRSGKYIPTLVDFKADVSTKLLGSGKNVLSGLGATTADVDINSIIIDGHRYDRLHALTYLGHQGETGQSAARDLVLHLTSDDAAARLSADIAATAADALQPWKGLPSDLQFSINVDHLSPSQLQLTNRWGQGVMQFKAEGNVASLDLNSLTADISLTDFSLSDDAGQSEPYEVSQFHVNALPLAGGSHIRLRSDFADVDYTGPIRPQELRLIASRIYESIQKGVFSEAKSVQTLAENADAVATDASADLKFILSFKDASFINRMLGIRANYAGTIQAQGSASADGRSFKLSCSAPTLTMGKFNIADLSIYARQDEGSFNLLGKVRKPLQKGGDVRLELTAINSDGNILTDIEWDESRHHAFYGKVSTITTFDLPASQTASAQRDLGIATHFIPSQLCIGDSIWQFSEGHLDYRGGRLAINNLGIHNAAQSLSINGEYSPQLDKAITVSLNNIDLDYALAFARLGVVDFSGHATGDIKVKALSNGDPWARAELQVPDFHFNHTPFGYADVTLGWDHAERDILIEGHITEPGVGKTIVSGYVDPINRNLDLQTTSEATPLGFLNKYTEGIFSDISGRATGNCRIYGGFRTIEFSGHETAQCQATIPITGVTYNVSNADVDIVPNAFVIRSADIRDQYSGKGTATGSLTHEHIKNLCYDFRLTGTNLRMYDQPRTLDMPFYATASGSGNVHIFGQPGTMNANIAIRTMPGSDLTYILDSPDADVSQLIKFNSAGNKGADAGETVGGITQTTAGTATAAQPTPQAASASDTGKPAASGTIINLDFEVDVDNQSCLHLITDDKSGDAINVYGSGPIQASYHNKSGFRMFGTYNIDRGTYNLNIPSLAQRRRFDILSGGRVNFSGDPANAEVKVKAQYVVNSASLADLNIGTGFANNTTRVNCIANIYGEVANMQFDLDLELPNCSQDEQQMVRNLIASDEDRTMQVLYLLGVGRFYAYNWNAADPAQSQSVLMMNSLLSSTLSSQLNSIISDAIGSNNWSFGTNISTGQMGWNDMEVEGLVSSRLLSGRLLLNGNFGYSERQAATTNFVGDFDMQYLITPKGTVSIRAYSETNDRYFTKSTLTTQGVGLQLKKDFTHPLDLFRRKKAKK